MRPESPTHIRRRRPVQFLGVPLERGAGTAGCLMGPAALRTAGLPQMLRDLGHEVIDCGDVARPEMLDTVRLGEAVTNRCNNVEEVAAWTGAIHDAAYALLQKGGVPMFIGGDHAISMGTVSAVARRAEEMGKTTIVLWIDAHADFNTPETTPSGNLHGMAVSFLCGDPLLRPLLGNRPFVPVPPANFRLFGQRSIDAEERLRLKTHGVSCTDMRMIDEKGVFPLISQVLSQIDPRTTHLHVSFDVDFVDPAVAPGTGTLVPGGATYREAHLIMEMLADSGLVNSVDVVELNPFLDERGRSCLLVAELVASLFGRTVLERAA